MHCTIRPYNNCAIEPIFIFCPCCEGQNIVVLFIHIYINFCSTIICQRRPEKYQERIKNVLKIHKSHSIEIILSQYFGCSPHLVEHFCGPEND